MNRDQALTATLDELRDALAEMDGWKFDPPEPCVPGGWWRWNAHPTLKSRTWCKSHPHPPTLDGADAAMPEGWTWCMCLDVAENEDGWYAWHKEAGERRSDGVYVPDTGNKIADLYRLAVLCRIAAKAGEK